MSTEFTITNAYGTFKWNLPEYGGPASALAKACFAEARAPYEAPDQVPGEGPTGTCPKCGGASHCTWLRAGETKTGRPDLHGLGKVPANRKILFTVDSECLFRQCACGYEWLAPVLANGGARE